MKKAEMELISELFNQKEVIEDFLATFYKRFSLEPRDIARFNMSVHLSDEHGNNVGFLILNDRDAKETIECIEARLRLINKELDELSVWGLDYLPESLKPLEVEVPIVVEDESENDCSEEGGEN